MVTMLRSLALRNHLCLGFSSCLPTEGSRVPDAYLYRHASHKEQTRADLPRRQSPFLVLQIRRGTAGEKARMETIIREQSHGVFNSPTENT